MKVNAAKLIILTSLGIAAASAHAQSYPVNGVVNATGPVVVNHNQVSVSASGWMIATAPLEKFAYALVIDNNVVFSSGKLPIPTVQPGLVLQANVVSPALSSGTHTVVWYGQCGPWTFGDPGWSITSTVVIP